MKKFRHLSLFSFLVTGIAASLFVATSLAPAQTSDANPSVRTSMPSTGNEKGLEDDTQSPVEFQRIFFPEKEASVIRDSLFAGNRFLYIKSDDFNQWLNIVEKTKQKKLLAFDESKQFVSLDLYARFEENQLVDGRGTLKLSPKENTEINNREDVVSTTNLLPMLSPAQKNKSLSNGRPLFDMSANSILFSPFGFPVNDPLWNDGTPAKLGVMAFGSSVLLKNPSSDTLFFFWSLKGQKEKNDVSVFHWEIPKLPFVELTLDLPHDRKPMVPNGVARLEEPPQKPESSHSPSSPVSVETVSAETTPSQVNDRKVPNLVPEGYRRWKITMNGNEPVTLTVVPDEKVAGTQEYPGLSETRIYDLSLYGLQLNTLFLLEKTDTPFHGVTIEFDKPLMPLKVKYGDQNLSWSETPSAQDNVTRIYVTLPTSDAGFRELQVQAFCPVKNDDQWVLPKVSLEKGKFFWNQTRSEIRVNRPLIVRNLDAEDWRQVFSGDVNENSPGDAFVFQAFSPDSKIGVEVGLTPPRLFYQSGTTLQWRDRDVVARSIVDLNVEEGPLQQFELELSPHWTLDLLEASEPSQINYYKNDDSPPQSDTVSPNARGTHWIVQMRSPFDKNHSLRLIVQTRRFLATLPDGTVPDASSPGPPGRSSTESIADNLQTYHVPLGEFRPVQVVNAREGTHLVSFDMSKEYHLTPSGENPPETTNVANDKIWERFGTIPSGPTYILGESQSLDILTVAPLKPTYRMSATTEVTVKDGRLTQQCLFSCVPSANSRVDKLYLCFSKEENVVEDNSGWTWGLGQEPNSSQQIKATRISQLPFSLSFPSEVSGLSVWEISLTPSRSTPFEFSMTRTISFRGETGIALPFSPEITQISAFVTISVADKTDYVLTQNQLEPVPPFLFLRPINAQAADFRSSDVNFPPASFTGSAASLRAAYRYHAVMDSPACANTELKLSPEARLSDTQSSDTSEKVSREKFATVIHGPKSMHELECPVKGYAWVMALHSIYAENGTVSNHVTILLENNRLDAFHLTFPKKIDKASLRNVCVDQKITRYETGNDSDALSTISIAIPLQKRYVFVEIEWTTKDVSLGSRNKILPLMPEIDVPVYRKKWYAWFPPEYDGIILSSERFSGVLHEDFIGNDDKIGGRIGSMSSNRLSNDKNVPVSYDLQKFVPTWNLAWKLFEPFLADGNDFEYLKTDRYYLFCQQNEWEYNPFSSRWWWETMFGKSEKSPLVRIAQNITSSFNDRALMLEIAKTATPAATSPVTPPFMPATTLPATLPATILPAAIPGEQTAGGENSKEQITSKPGMDHSPASLTWEKLLTSPLFEKRIRTNSGTGLPYSSITFFVDDMAMARLGITPDSLVFGNDQAGASNGIDVLARNNLAFIFDDHGVLLTSVWDVAKWRNNLVPVYGNHFWLLSGIGISDYLRLRDKRGGQAISSNVWREKRQKNEFSEFTSHLVRYSLQSKPGWVLCETSFGGHETPALILIRRDTLAVWQFAAFFAILLLLRFRVMRRIGNLLLLMIVVLAVSGFVPLHDFRIVQGLFWGTICAICFVFIRYKMPLILKKGLPKRTEELQNLSSDESDGGEVRYPGEHDKPEPFDETEESPRHFSQITHHLSFLILFLIGITVALCMPGLEKNKAFAQTTVAETTGRVSRSGADENPLLSTQTGISAPAGMPAQAGMSRPAFSPGGMQNQVVSGERTDDAIAAVGREFHRVFIPLDEQNRPVGHYYISENMYRLLSGAFERSRNHADNWQIQTARYQGALIQSPTGEKVLLSGLKATYAVEIFDRSTTIRLPAMPSSPNGAKLDQQPVLQSVDSKTGELLFEITGRGKHQLEISLAPETGETTLSQQFDFPIPEVLDSTLELTLPFATMPISVSNAIGRIQMEAGLFKVDLGPLKQLTVFWPIDAPAVATDSVSVAQFFWLRVRPNQTVLRALYKYRITGNRVRQVQLYADPRYQISGRYISPEAEIEQVESISEQNGTVRILFKKPVSGDLTIRADYALKDFSGIGAVHLPAFSAINVRVDRSWLGVSVDPSLEVTLPPSSVTPKLFEFDAAWEPTGETFQYAFDLLRTTNAWSMSIRSKPTNYHIEQKQNFLFRNQQAILMLEAVVVPDVAPGNPSAVQQTPDSTVSANASVNASQNTTAIATTVSSPPVSPASSSSVSVPVTGVETFDYQLRLPRDFRDEKVELKNSQGVVQPTPRLERKDDILTIFFKKPLSGRFSFTLAGSVPFSIHQPFAFPLFGHLRGNVTDDAMSLFRDTTVQLQLSVPDLSTKASDNLTSPPPAFSDCYLVKAFRVIDREKFSESKIDVTLNQPHIAGEQVVVLERNINNDHWETAVHWHLNIEGGELDQTRIFVPIDLSGTLVATDPAMSVRQTTKSNGTLIQLTPRIPMSGDQEFSIRFPISGTLDTATLPDIQFQNPASLKQCVAIPVQVQLKPIQWSLNGLVPLGESPVPSESLRKILSNPVTLPKTATYQFYVPGDDSYSAKITTTREMPMVLCQDTVFILKKRGDGMVVSTFDVQSQGISQCDLVLPKGSRLIQMKSGNIFPKFEQVGESHYRIDLWSGVITQRIQVVYTLTMPPVPWQVPLQANGGGTPGSTDITLTFPRLVSLPVQKTFWEVYDEETPNAFRIQGESGLLSVWDDQKNEDAVPWNALEYQAAAPLKIRMQLMRLNQLLAILKMVPAGTTPADLAMRSWYALWENDWQSLRRQVNSTVVRQPSPENWEPGFSFPWQPSPDKKSDEKKDGGITAGKPVVPASDAERSTIDFINDCFLKKNPPQTLLRGVIQQYDELVKMTQQLGPVSPGDDTDSVYFVEQLKRNLVDSSQNVSYSAGVRLHGIERLILKKNNISPGGVGDAVVRFLIWGLIPVALVIFMTRKKLKRIVGSVPVFLIAGLAIVCRIFFPLNHFGWSVLAVMFLFAIRMQWVQAKSNLNTRTINGHSATTETK